MNIMRKALMGVVAVTLAFAVCGTADANLTPDPGFEGISPQWSFDGHAGYTTDEAKSGTQSGYVNLFAHWDPNARGGVGDWFGGYPAVFKNSVPAKPDTVYYFSVWVKGRDLWSPGNPGCNPNGLDPAPSGCGDWPLYVIFNIRFNTTPDLGLSHPVRTPFGGDQIPMDGNWYQITSIFTTPANTNSVNIKFGGSYCDDIIYFDDWYIAEKPVADVAPVGTLSAWGDMAFGPQTLNISSHGEYYNVSVNLLPTVSSADVTLDGSGSSDPEGLPLTYNWVIKQGATVVATSTDANPTFNLGVGTYRAELVVNNGVVNSDVFGRDFSVGLATGADFAGGIYTLNGHIQDDGVASKVTYDVNGNIVGIEAVILFDRQEVSADYTAGPDRVITLTGTDPNGGSISFSDTIDVIEGGPNGSRGKSQY